MITFCGVGAHHQNGIIENKNKTFTLGACTLFLHGMRYWPQMIYTMFWPFAMKAFAKQMNNLHVDLNSKTPESKMYGVSLNKIPVNAEGAGPPKWKPRSCIRVYLGHSPFHAGSIALIFNPKSGCVSPQYHVIFDNDFTTVPFMDQGDILPNWADLCWHSAESSTDDPSTWHSNGYLG
eukprot:4047959-Ditylum_brightwellii.AAC.1